MQRECSRCGTAFRPGDLSKEDSKKMESERKGRGLRGVLFRYYTCSMCGHADIFVDLRRLEGETPQAFHERREEMEAAARRMHADEVGVVVVAN